ncbi:MAG: efflux RND transporter periplasmic adaptor subunit [Chitinispirillia bacterium]|nr:efflux RND transporter periplasmic adaptor subunit [Chitinispirillia bacterium]MCL2241827.1 efflux RND transporter periplasmic adaptor subunit [Chitinispirillia bacterium]
MGSKSSKSGIKGVIIGVITLILAGGGAGGYFHYQRHLDNRPKEYDTVEVKRGTVERLITSTGTLDPVGSVEVGTQVSGTVDKVLVDFNDTVRAGQIIAEIDRSVLISKLTEAQASLSRAEALFSQSEQEFKRGEQLFGKGLISEQEFVNLRTNFQSQQASLQVSKAAVNTAAENVRYATIRSPIKGTVISRKVDVGQTVAASLNAPTLFIIAEDLKKMKIMAQVDETDIGRIRPNQEVRFSVQAYPDKSYRGTVSQVRLQPEIIQNVVTYSVVILAGNDDGTLLPGMTANVEFVEAREEGALVVPASALRFQPPEEVVKRFEEERRAKFAEMGEGKARAGADGADGRGMMAEGGQPGPFPPDGADGSQRKKGDGGQKMKDGGGQSGQKMREGGQGGGRQGRRQAGVQQGGRGILWTLDENREFKPVYVRIVLTDGVQAAVSGRGDELREGLKAVTGEVRQDSKKSGGKQTRSLLPQPGGPVPRKM